MYSTGKLKDGQRHGKGKVYNNNGVLRYETIYNKGKREDGLLGKKGHYRDGKEEGFWEYYIPHSTVWLLSKGNYKNGEREAVWHFFSAGKKDVIREITTFKNGVKVE